MDVDPEYFNERKEKAEQIYNAQKSIFNPYFKTQIILNSDGFHHLQFSARRERNKNITFWSVMPYSKFKQEGQKLFTEGIEDE